MSIVVVRAMGLLPPPPPGTETGSYVWVAPSLRQSVSQPTDDVMSKSWLPCSGLQPSVGAASVAASVVKVGLGDVSPASISMGDMRELLSGTAVLPRTGVVLPRYAPVCTCVDATCALSSGVAGASNTVCSECCKVASFWRFASILFRSPNFNGESAPLPAASIGLVLCTAVSLLVVVP